MCAWSLPYTVRFKPPRYSDQPSSRTSVVLSTRPIEFNEPCRSPNSIMASNARGKRVLPSTTMLFNSRETASTRGLHYCRMSLWRTNRWFSPVGAYYSDSDALLAIMRDHTKLLALGRSTPATTKSQIQIYSPAGESLLTLSVDD